MRRFIGGLVFILCLLGLAAFATFFLKNPTREDKEALVIMPHGTTIASLADSLAAHRLIRSKLSFRVAARLLGASQKLHAGVFRIGGGLSNLQIVERVTGTEYAIIFRATFPEGINARKAASIAHEKLGLDSSLFMKYTVDTAFLHHLGVPQEAKSAEGYLFPDTYQFILAADPKSLIQKMVEKWKSVVTDSMKTEAEAMKLSIQQWMTFASIVEAEAKLPAERDTIAGVYWNRLDQGMKLDADPTVQYGLGLSRQINHEDLSIRTPYNTYMLAGLPPGPISNPGKAAMLAVLHPAQHRDLYFVARRDGSGGHYFSRSLKEQDRMIRLASRNADSQ